MTHVTLFGRGDRQTVPQASTKLVQILILAFRGAPRYSNVIVPFERNQALMQAEDEYAEENPEEMEMEEEEEQEGEVRDEEKPTSVSSPEPACR